MADILKTLQQRLSGTYAVERELGRGGMATVYFARDLVHDRDVAIKVLNPDLSATIGAERFNREITLASRLNHPHILGFYESGQTDGLLYYVMPFVRGESLRDKIDREGQLSVTDAVRIIREVAGALGHAHEQNVVHRDVKPENILLLEDGHSLVADFGIARAATEGDAQKLTQTGMAIGTPVYMSPEQSTGEKVGPAADIYSLGCVLYEMLSGEPPFTGKNAMAIMARHAMETVPAIRIVRSSVPEEVEEAIFAAMEKAPVDRPKSCAEFIEILGTPIGETAMRRVTRMTPARRMPLPPATPWYKQPALLVGVLVLLAGGGFGVWKFTSGATKATLGDDARRIAVLYFDNDTRDPELGYLSDGITESVIQSLSGVPVLQVVSRGGSEQFRGSQASADSIARALDVGIVVRGNVEKEGDKIRVNVRLLDASGTPLDSKAVGPFAGTSLSLRDSVATQVALLIKERLGTEITLREQRDATQNEQAWLLLQRAEALRKRAETMLASQDAVASEQAFQRADSLLMQAAALDRKWPGPLNLRAQMMYRRARLSLYDKDRMRGYVDSGLVYAKESLERSVNNPDGLEMRGSITYLKAIGGLVPNGAEASAMVSAAQKDLEQARTINPLQAGAWATLSHLYNRTGTAEDVNEAAKKALEADAFQADAYNVLDRLFLSSYDLGFTDRATEYCAQTGRRFPGTQRAYRCQLMIMTMPKAKNLDAAKAWTLSDSTVSTAAVPQKAAQRLINDMYVAAVLARLGLKDSARAVAQRSRGDEEVDPAREAMLRGAFVYTLLGDTTAAVNALKSYLLLNEGQREAFKDDAGWWFRPLENNADFRRLVGASP
jgi:serine/threonine-protein kinase